MGALVLVFLLLGVGGGGRFPDAFRAPRADSVVSTGDHSMSATDYRRIFEQQKQNLEAQSKQTYTNEFLVQNGADEQLLNQIAQDQGLAELLSRVGIVPAPSLVDAQIKQIPQAFDRVTGKFSEAQYTQLLAAQGLTPKQVEADLTDQLAERHFGLALQAGFRAPRAVAALTAIAGLQSRDVSYFVLDSRAVVPPAQPTDAELLAFMKAHAAQLTRPEMRVVKLVKFSAAALAPGVTVSDADIQKAFDARKGGLSSPETRLVIQIPVKTAADGAAAAKRLAAGEDPAAVAKAYGSQPIVYDGKPRTAILDQKVGDVAFAMSAGQAKGPVQGDLGLAALKVVSITPAKTVTLASQRAAIEADLKSQAAKAKAYAQSQAFDDARQGGASVTDAAQKVGAALVSIGPFSATGVDGLGRPIAEINEKIAKAAFALRAGEDSDLQDAGSGEYFALKVDQVLAPALPALNEIRAPLAQAFIQQKLVAALQAKGTELAAQAQQGKPMDQLAASVGSHVENQPGIQLIQAAKYKALGQELLAGTFQHKAGDAFIAGAPNGVFVARLNAIRPADPVATAQLLETIRARASEDYLRDLINSAKTAARDSVKVTINLALARKAVGVDDATVGKAGGTPAGKSGGLAQ